MSLSICPAAVVQAPVELVWELLTEPARRDEWWGVRTERTVPEGDATPGQVIYLRPMLLKVTLRVERVDPEKHQIHWILTSPGTINNQTTTCTAIDSGSCRVQYG